MDALDLNAAASYDGGAASGVPPMSGVLVAGYLAGSNLPPRVPVLPCGVGSFRRRDSLRAGKRRRTSEGDGDSDDGSAPDAAMVVAAASFPALSLHLPATTAVTGLPLDAGWALHGGSSRYLDPYAAALATAEALGYGPSVPWAGEVDVVRMLPGLSLAAGAGTSDGGGGGGPAHGTPRAAPAPSPPSPRPTAAAATPGSAGGRDAEQQAATAAGAAAPPSPSPFTTLPTTLCSTIIHSALRDITVCATNLAAIEAVVLAPSPPAGAAAATTPSRSGDEAATAPAAAAAAAATCRSPGGGGGSAPPPAPGATSSQALAYVQQLRMLCSEEADVTTTLCTALQGGGGGAAGATAASLSTRLREIAEGAQATRASLTALLVVKALDVGMATKLIACAGTVQSVAAQLWTVLS